MDYQQIEKHVHLSPYEDFKGIIKIDGHHSITSIEKLCNDYGFKTNDKFIVGFGFEEITTNGVGRKDKICCRIYYIDKGEYGDNYDAIKEKIKENEFLILKKEVFNIRYSDLGKYIKRFSFIALSDISNLVDFIEIEED